MAITQQDIETVRRLLAEHAQAVETETPPQGKGWRLMTDEEFVARKLGDISRGRARRLIIAARQNKTTEDIRKQRTPRRRQTR